MFHHLKRKKNQWGKNRILFYEHGQLLGYSCCPTTLELCIKVKEISNHCLRKREKEINERWLYKIILHLQ